MLNEVCIEIIRKCPNKCVYCSSCSGPDSEEIIDYEDISAIVSDALKLGAKTICISGGEPFLHPQIMEIVELINSKGLNLYIYTSGIMMDKKGNSVSLPKRTLNSITGKVNKLIFNIQASNPIVYNTVMGTTGCFSKLKKSVRNANQLDIQTEAHFVPMKLNINEINETIELCQSLNISTISFLRFVSHGRAKLNEKGLLLSNEENLVLKKNLINLQTNSKMKIRIGVPLSKEATCTKCEAGYGKISIKYDGSVYPCEIYKNDIIKAENVEPDNIHANSFYDIYLNSAYLNYFRKVSKDYYGYNHEEMCIGQDLIIKAGGSGDGE